MSLIDLTFLFKCKGIAAQPPAERQCVYLLNYDGFIYFLTKNDRYPYRKTNFTYIAV